MSTTAKFFRTFTVNDPDTGAQVELSVYKHENGGILAIDSSYVDQVLNMDDDDINPMCMPDPFATFDEPEALYLEDDE